MSVQEAVNECLIYAPQVGALLGHPVGEVSNTFYVGLDCSGGVALVLQSSNVDIDALAEW
jgi:hypothetical protein